MTITMNCQKSYNFLLSRNIEAICLLIISYSFYVTCMSKCSIYFLGKILIIEIKLITCHYTYNT